MIAAATYIDGDCLLQTYSSGCLAYIQAGGNVNLLLIFCALGLSILRKLVAGCPALALNSSVWLI